MTMTIELARFGIHEGAEAALVSEHQAMMDALRERFPGCLAAYLTRQDDGDWLHVLVWRDRAEAERAAQVMAEIPACAAWLRHIAEPGGLHHAEIVDAWAP